jgi:mannose-6-phosphate isomerase
MPPAIDSLPPLRFQRRTLEKVWGGRRLALVPGIELPPARPIGESWEISDRDEEPSVVAEGPLAGTLLRDLVLRRRVELLGRARTTADGRFPLLVKYVDTSQPLSIQVHPLASDARTGDEGKSEAWYFLHAEPSSRVWIGLAPGTTPDELAAAAGTSAITPLVREWPVRAGDAAFVPGGTVHAIGGGVTVLEVQENSDTTHRLYDWDRPGLDGGLRPIHVESALRATDFTHVHAGPQTPQWRDVAGGRRAMLAECARFVLEHVEVASAQDDETRDLAVAWAIVRGRGRLTCASGAYELRPGEVWLVPAATGHHRLEATEGSLSAVRIGTQP